MGRTQVQSRVETLPYSWYADPAVAAAERDRIFRRSWQYAGHTGELSGPGSMFPTQVGGLPVGVVRDGGGPGRCSPTRGGGFPVVFGLDGEGELPAFLNVCRHRAKLFAIELQSRGTI